MTGPKRKPAAKPQHVKAQSGAKLLRLDSCRERNLAWLWHNRVPLGKATLLVGDPDSGKSFLALDLAARVSRGLGVPPEPGLGQPAQVLLLCADDDVEDTILPRLRAADADLGNIAILAAGPRKSASQSQALLSLSKDLDQLEAVLKKLPNCRLIVIDPINAYLAGLAGNNDVAIRQFLQKLTRLARDRSASILLTAHQRKQTTSTALYRPLGSVAFAAVARVVFLLTQDPAVAGRRLLVPAKMTLQAASAGRAFRIDEGRIVWEPDLLDFSADDLRVMAADDSKSSDARRDAKEWLISQLEHGRLRASEIKRRADESHIPWRILWAAKKDAQVSIVRDGKERVYYWKLPDNWIRDFSGQLFPVVI